MNNKDLKSIPSVYAYYFPEVRRLIDRLVKDYPHQLLLESIFPGLDNYHLPVAEQLVNFYKGYQTGLADFPHRYFSNGSSESIFHLLVWLKQNYPQKPIYVLKGEYEGYKAYARNLGLGVVEVDDIQESNKKLPLGVWLISNPSARDGNLIKNSQILALANRGHKLILDLAYIGMTRRYRMDLRHDNIIAVITSLSKPFGLFYYRVGFTFSKEPINTLVPNKWFKNIFSLLITKSIFDNFNPAHFYTSYFKLRQKIFNRIYRETSIKIKPSDVLLLGYLRESEIGRLTPKQKDIIARFKRGNNYRFCLTPYFLELEKT